MLIARLIADMEGVETRLDAAMQACAAADMPVAMAGLLDFCGDVLQLSLPHGDRAQLTAILVEHFGECDLLVADHEIEIPRLFVSDMDSTMIGQECIDELADYAGIKDQVAAITERAMQGELDFTSALKERVGLLEGLEEEVKVAKKRTLKRKPPPGTLCAMYNPKRRKYTCCAPGSTKRVRGFCKLCGQAACFVDTKCIAAHYAAAHGAGGGVAWRAGAHIAHSAIHKTTT